MLDVQGGAHKKRARRSSLLNAKKLYEDAQMARKVKQYLCSLEVETDEEKFQMMSLQWEPAYGTCEYRVPLHDTKSTRQEKPSSPKYAQAPIKLLIHSQRLLTYPKHHVILFITFLSPPVLDIYFVRNR